MKHRKFVKHLMAVGVSRNTAEEAAAAAARRGRALYDTLGDLLNLRVMCNVVGLTTREDFVRYVRYGALFGSGKPKTPVPVIITTHSPLLPDCLHREIMEVVRQKTPAELSEELPAPGLWPKINPSLGGGGNV